MYYQTTYDSPLGKVFIFCNDQHVKGVYFATQKLPKELAEIPCMRAENPVAKQVKTWLDDYFSHRMPPILRLPLAPDGTTFRRLVWHLLCQIPYGQVRTYCDLAKEVAAMEGKASMSAQAIGGAVGHNPLAIIIPCHRVVGANGNLTGYAGGIDKKIALLKHEGRDMSAYVK